MASNSGHVWTSPSDLSGSVSFRATHSSFLVLHGSMVVLLCWSPCWGALCGDSQEMWYAAEVCLCSNQLKHLVVVVFFWLWFEMLEGGCRGRFQIGASDCIFKRLSFDDWKSPIIAEERQHRRWTFHNHHHYKRQHHNVSGIQWITIRLSWNYGEMNGSLCLLCFHLCQE